MFSEKHNAIAIEMLKQYAISLQRTGISFPVRCFIHIVV